MGRLRYALIAFWRMYRRLREGIIGYFKDISFHFRGILSCLEVSLKHVYFFVCFSTGDRLLMFVCCFVMYQSTIVQFTGTRFHANHIQNNFCFVLSTPLSTYGTLLCKAAFFSVRDRGCGGCENLMCAEHQQLL